MFKAGDKVTCINDYNATNLRKGDKYEVIDIYEKHKMIKIINNIRVEDVYHNYRFVLANKEKLRKEVW